MLPGEGWRTIFARLFKNTALIKEITPYQEANTPKKVQVQRMFDRISGHYDFLNHLLSLGIDIRWRKKAISLLTPPAGGHLLDVATGTGDMALLMAKRFPDVSITGIDIAEQMLAVAKAKQQRAAHGGQVTFTPGDCENLAFADNSFDAVTVAFGVRNYENLQKGLREMYRVVKPGGQAVILEFTKPRIFPFKQLFHAYFKYLLPVIGSLHSRDKRAYRYLYESVQSFPDYTNFNTELKKAGWRHPEYQILSLGICTIYTAIK